MGNDGCGVKHRGDSVRANGIRFFATRGLALILIIAMNATFVPWGGGRLSYAQQPNKIDQEKVFRLFEMLGSLHYLDPLCRETTSSPWRAKASTLLDKLTIKSEAKQRLIAHFNSSYRSLREIYRKCNPSARRLIIKYLREGVETTKQLIRKFKS